MNKQAILVISFGTSYPETREKTIDAIEQTLSAAFPDRAFYRAWSSGFIIRKLAKSGIYVDSVETALERMWNEGIRDILIQPTHMLNAQETEITLSQIRNSHKNFDVIRFGRPLLTTEADLRAVADTLPVMFPMVSEKDALVLVGHGTEHPENKVYAELNDLLTGAGKPNFCIGTVESVPGIKDVLARLAALPEKPERVWLTPFLIVAGDHANNDINGEDEDSWRMRLTKEGYEVSVILKGLGEYPEIHTMFVEHAKEAELLTI